MVYLPLGSQIALIRSVLGKAPFGVPQSISPAQEDPLPSISPSSRVPEEGAGAMDVSAAAWR